MTNSSPLLLDNATEQDIKNWVVASRDAAGHSHAVYVLDCTPSSVDSDFRIESIVDHTLKKIDRNESLSEREKAARALAQGGNVYYVGYTNDVVDRLHGHTTGASAGGADFTNLFKPRLLTDIHWFTSESRARNREPQIASRMSSTDGDFAFWN